MAGQQNLLVRLMLEFSDFIKGTEKAGEQLNATLPENHTVHVGLDTKPAEHSINSLNTRLSELRQKQSAALSVEDAKRYQVEINKIEKELSDVNAQLTKVGNKGIGSKLTGSVKELASSSVGVAGGIFAVGAALGKFYDAGEKADEVADGLNTAFKTAGLSGDALTEALARQDETATKLGQKYGKNKAEIDAATTSYLKFGGTTTDLGKKQELIIALAEKIGTSAEAAGKMVAKSTDEESTAGLAKANIRFKDGATEAEKFAVMAEKLKGTMSGMQDAVDPVDRTKASFDNMLAVVGRLVFDGLQPLFEIISVVLDVLQVTLIPVIKAVLGVFSSLTGVIKKFGEAVWEVIVFFAKWMNPIGLLIQGMKLLYDKVEFVKVAIDGLIDTVVSVGKWFTDLLGITDEDVKKKEKQVVATKEVTKTQEQLTKELEKQAETWNEVGSSMDKILSNKTSIAIQKNHELKMAMKSGNAAMIADAKKAADEALADAKEFKAAKVTMDKEGQEVKDVLDPKKKTGGDTKTLKDKFDEEKRIRQVALDNELLELKQSLALGAITREEHQKEEKKKQQDHNTALIALADKYIADAQKGTKKEKELVKDFEAERLSLVRQGVDDVIAEREELAKKEQAQLKEKLEGQAKVMRQVGMLLYEEQFAVERQIAIDNYEGQADLLFKHVSQKLITEEEYTKQIVALKEATNARLAEVDQQRIAKEKEMAELRMAVSGEDEFARKLRQMEAAFKAEQDLLKTALDNKKLAYDEYLLRVQLAQQNYDKAREEAVTEQVKKESAIYQAANSAIQSMFKDGVEGLKKTLMSWLSTEKKEKDKNTQQDKERLKQETKAEALTLEQQMKAGEISYQEYRKKKTDIERKNDQEEIESEQEKQNILLSLTTNFAMSMIDIGAQVVQSVISTTIAQLIAGEALSIGKFIQSVMALPFPANVLAIGGGTALLVGLFTGLLGDARSAEARETGGVIKPGGFYKVGEKEEEYLSIDSSGHGYVYPTGNGRTRPAGSRAEEEDENIDKSLRIGSFAGGIDGDSDSWTATALSNIITKASLSYNTGTMASYRETASGGVMPRISPSLEMNHTEVKKWEEQSRVNDRMISAIERLADEGIPIDLVLEGDKLIAVTRTAQRKADRRVYRNNQG